MFKENTITAHPKTEEQYNIITAIIKAMKIPYEVNAKEKYNPEFVKKILKGDKNLKEGKGIKMNVQDFKKLCKYNSLLTLYQI